MLTELFDLLKSEQNSINMFISKAIYSWGNFNIKTLKDSNNSYWCLYNEKFQHCLLIDKSEFTYKCFDCGKMQDIKHRKRCACENQINHSVLTDFLREYLNRLDKYITLTENHGICNVQIKCLQIEYNESVNSALIYKSVIRPENCVINGIKMHKTVLNKYTNHFTDQIDIKIDFPCEIITNFKCFMYGEPIECNDWLMLCKFAKKIQCSALIKLARNKLIEKCDMKSLLELD